MNLFCQSWCPSIVAGIVFLASQPVAEAAPVGFYPLGNIAGSHTYSFGLSVSGDGLVVGGESGESPFSPALTGAGVWRGPNWATKSAVPPTNTIEPYALLWDLNFDGSVGAGITALPTGDPADPTVSAPARWTPSGGMEVLSTLSGQSHALSADGSVVVGQIADPSLPLAAFRWTAADGLVVLPTLGATDGVHVAYGVSADGNVVTGRSRKAGFTTNSAFAWTPALGSVELAELPGATGTTRGQGRGVNAAGTVVVGLARDANGAPHAARWSFDPATGASTVASLGDLPGGLLPDGVAYGVSDDGRTIVGQSASDVGDEAFLWRPGLGMTSLKNYLVDVVGVANLADWRLVSAEDVSGDGTVIVGYGELNGATQAWVAVVPPVPEPASLGLAGLVVLGLLSGTHSRRLRTPKARAFGSRTTTGYRSR